MWSKGTETMNKRGNESMNVNERNHTGAAITWLQRGVIIYIFLLYLSLIDSC